MEEEYDEVFSQPRPQQLQEQQQQQQQQREQQRRQELIELCRQRSRHIPWASASQQGFQPIPMPRFQPSRHSERLILPSDLGPLLERICSALQTQEVRLRQCRREVAELRVRMVQAEARAEHREKTLHRVNIGLMIFASLAAIIVAVLLILTKYGGADSNDNK